MQIYPLSDFVLIRPVVPEAKSSGGLIIPHAAQKENYYGEVVATGPGRFSRGKRLPMWVKKGETVMYRHFVGTNIKVNGVEHIILHQTDVTAKLLP